MTRRLFWRTVQGKETTMGLFGLGSKRNPLPPRTALRPQLDMALPKTAARSNMAAPGGLYCATGPHKLGAPPPRTGAGQQEGVEVCELSLGDDEFSSTFGPASSQFADTVIGPDDARADPWTGRLRLD